MIDTLSREYDVKELCELMGVSRSGYYKWKNRGRSSQEKRRIEMISIVQEVHNDHPSHGYRWVHAYILTNYKVKCSSSFIYTIFRYLGIQSKTKHKEHRRPRKIKDKYPNLIFSTWETVDRPRQVIVSDMTAFKFWIYYFEVTFYFDVFTKQILSWSVAERRGSRHQYIDGLQKVLKILTRGAEEPTILHTDQGSVYASIAYNELIKDYNIQRSMSRAGKPTDNPVNESLNGWIKEELFMDFKIDRCRSREEFIAVIERYVEFYNKERPSYALDYDTPNNYYRRFKRGEIEQKDTFSKRELSEEPKFVRKKRAKAAEVKQNQGVSTSADDVSTSENAKGEKVSDMSTIKNDI